MMTNLVPRMDKASLDGLPEWNCQALISNYNVKNLEIYDNFLFVARLSLVLCIIIINSQK